jgi:hypothetical protein
MDLQWRSKAVADVFGNVDLLFQISQYATHDQQGDELFKIAIEQGADVTNQYIDRVIASNPKHQLEFPQSILKNIYDTRDVALYKAYLRLEIQPYTRKVPSDVKYVMKRGGPKFADAMLEYTRQVINYDNIPTGRLNSVQGVLFCESRLYYLDLVLNHKYSKEVGRELVSILPLCKKVLTKLGSKHLRKQEREDTAFADLSFHHLGLVFARFQQKLLTSTTVSAVADAAGDLLIVLQRAIRLADKHFPSDFPSVN